MTRDNSPKVPGPKELMRQLHPDLFSDSRVDDIVRLPKAVFEYHLDTLTSRKQEYEFEHFCRKLAEKEVCPNLRTQTGPTGGGDSKVDTETYPVAEEISKRWWVGSTSAGSERWAFAFSAKKEWKPKVKSDVENILSTGRDYRRIYFFTNQFVKDKDRANQEDALSIQADIPVHIFDRVWIVEKVYGNGHLELAVNALNIEDARSEEKSRLGPHDTARLGELEELDQQVADPSRYQGARYQLAEDCLRSAILARSLERPRSEVESRFEQADRLALDVNYNPQLLRISYNRAWTAFWWYEDYSAFNRFYEEVEQRVKGSTEASEAQLLLNFWRLLPAAVQRKNMSATEAKVEPRRNRLTSVLESIASDSARPNNALEARTGLAFMKFTLALSAEKTEQFESCCIELTQILEESETLNFYPVEQIFYGFTELDIPIDSLNFNTLCEKITEVISRRSGEREAGKVYAKRGTQKLQRGKFYEAVQLFGKAERLLPRNECQEELVMTLVESSRAYAQAGLLWAARHKALAAVERASAVFTEQGDVDLRAYAQAGLLWAARHKALAAVERASAVFTEQGDVDLRFLEAADQLVWVELGLKRIPHVLNAITFADSVASNLNLSEENLNLYVDKRRKQEAVLSVYLFNLPFKSLSYVTRLPDTLEKLGFRLARVALLFALGHEQLLLDETGLEDWDAVQNFFKQSKDQTIEEDVSPRPILVSGNTSFLKSTILGLEFIAETPNNAVSFCIAESILGALETFLATSDEKDIMPHCERMTIAIRASRRKKGIPQISFSDDDGGRAEIVHPEKLNFTTGSEWRNYKEWLDKSLLEIVCRTFVIPNVDAWCKRVAEEEAYSCILSIGDSLLLTGNVFGETFNKMRLVDWLEPDGRDYDVIRKGDWKKTEDSSNSGKSKKSAGRGTAPTLKTPIDRSRLKHTDRRVVSPIDILLWDRANWLGVCYGDSPPVLGIIFEDSHAGQAIFRSWMKKWGDEDKDNSLRVTIVTGLSKKNPGEYAVAVGPNIPETGEQKERLFTFGSRIYRRTLSDQIPLENFLTAYKRTGVFFLAPAQMNASEPKLFPELAIGKRQLVIRQAWEIGENDFDAYILRDDDEPVNPS